MNNESSKSFSFITESLAAIIPDTPIVSIAGSTLSEITTTTTSTTTTPTPTSFEQNKVDILSSTPMSDVFPDIAGDGDDIEKIKITKRYSKNQIRNEEENSDSITGNDSLTENNTFAIVRDDDTSESAIEDIEPTPLCRRKTANSNSKSTGCSYRSKDLSPHNCEHKLKDAESLEDFKKLLEEAFSYKTPRDRENKSETFLQLLKNAESVKDELPRGYPAVKGRYTRHSSSSAGSSNNHNQHHNTIPAGGSLQDIVNAVGNEALLDCDCSFVGTGGSRNRRHNHNSRQKKTSTVSSRQSEGGSLPNNVNVANCSTLEHQFLQAADKKIGVIPLSNTVNNSVLNTNPIVVNTKQRRNNIKVTTSVTGITSTKDTTKDPYGLGINITGVPSISLSLNPITQNTTITKEITTNSVVDSETTGNTKTIDNNCIIEMGDDFVEFQQQQQQQPQNKSYEHELLKNDCDFYELMRKQKIPIRSSIIGSSNSQIEVVSGKQSLIDETLRFTALEHGSSNATAAAAAAAGSNNKTIDAKYLPLDDNYKSFKSVLENNDLKKDPKAILAPTKTPYNAVRQLDENANALNDIFNTNGNANVLNSNGVNMQSATVNKVKEKKPSKKSQDRNTIEVDVKAVVGYRGNDSIDALVKYIENCEDKNETKGNNKFAEKKRDRKKDKQEKQQKIKKSNSLEELTSCSKIDVDELKDSAATTENNNVIMRNKGKNNKNNSSSTADINKNIDGGKELNAGSNNKTNTITSTAVGTSSSSTGRKNERRSWGTEELQYLGESHKNNAICGGGGGVEEKKDKEIHKHKDGHKDKDAGKDNYKDKDSERDIKDHHKDKEIIKDVKDKEKDKKSNVNNKDKDKDKEKKKEKEKDNEKERENNLIEKNTAVVKDYKNSEKPIENGDKCLSNISVGATAIIKVTTQGDKVDKQEKRKKQDNNNYQGANHPLAVTVIDILPMESVMPETAEFHVVTKRRKPKKQRTGLEDIGYNNNSTNTTGNNNNNNNSNSNNNNNNNNVNSSTGGLNRTQHFMNNIQKSTMQNIRYKYNSNYNNNNNNNNNNNGYAISNNYNYNNHNNSHHINYPQQQQTSVNNDKTRRKSASSMPSSDKSDSSDLDSVHSLPVESIAKNKQRHRNEVAEGLSTLDTNANTTEILPSGQVGGVRKQTSLSINSPRAPISYADIARTNIELAAAAAAVVFLQNGPEIWPTVSDTVTNNSLLPVDTSSPIVNNEEFSSPPAVSNTITTTVALKTSKAKKKTPKSDFPELVATSVAQQHNVTTGNNSRTISYSQSLITSVSNVCTIPTSSSVTTVSSIDETSSNADTTKESIKHENREDICIAEMKPDIPDKQPQHQESYHHYQQLSPQQFPNNSQQSLQKAKSVENEHYNYNSDNMDQQYPALEKTVKRHSANSVTNVVNSAANTVQMVPIKTVGPFNFAEAAKQPLNVTSTGMSSSKYNPTTGLSNAVEISNLSPSSSSGVSSNASAIVSFGPKKYKEKSPPLDAANNISSNELYGQSSQHQQPYVRKSKKNKYQQQVQQLQNETQSNQATLIKKDTILENQLLEETVASASEKCQHSQKQQTDCYTPRQSLTDKNVTVALTNLHIHNIRSAKQQQLPLLQQKQYVATTVNPSNTSTSTNTNTGYSVNFNRPAVIIMNDNKFDNGSNNEFTFGDFNADELKFFDDDITDENNAPVIGNENQYYQAEDEKSKHSPASRLQGGGVCCLNDSGASLDVANSTSHHIDEMMFSTVEQSSPNTSFISTSHYGANDSGIYTNLPSTVQGKKGKYNQQQQQQQNVNRRSVVIPSEQQHLKKNTIDVNVMANPSLINTPNYVETGGIGCGDILTSPEALSELIDSSAHGLPPQQLETCNDIESVIFAAARAAAFDEQTQSSQQYQHHEDYNYINPNYQQQQEQEQEHQQQHYQNEQNSLSNSTSSCSSGVSASIESTLKDASPLTVDEYTSDFHNNDAGGGPYVVNISHKDFDLHFIPPNMSRHHNALQHNDTIVEFIGSAWEEIANSSVTQFYDGQ